MESLVPPGGPFEPLAQSVQPGFVDLTEKCEGHVPPVGARPPQSWPLGPERRDRGLQFGESLLRRRQRHEQSHPPLLPVHATRSEALDEPIGGATGPANTPPMNPWWRYRPCQWPSDEPLV